MDLNWKFALGNAADPKADFGFGQYMSYLAKQSLSTPVLAEHVTVGVAVPDSVWVWRVRRLKEDLGANAIRMSHNPPAPALLDACDRQGILVMDEQRIFSSSQEGLAQLESLVRRDRNHPSVIIWSAGNEEWGLQNSPFSDQIMTKLQTEFHHLDPTRRVICAASNGGQDQGINCVADVRGINYVSAFEKGDTPALYHRRHPNQPIIGSEEGGGTDLWKFAQETPWYSGYFIWTGFGYYGECKWPDVVAPFGAMDICGFPRQPAYDFYQTNWAGKVVHNEVTGSSATGIQLEPDRTSLNADGEDTSVVNVAIVDANHHRVGKASDVLTFHISGPGTILGIGNSANDDHSSAKDDYHNAFEGRAQVLVQTTRDLLGSEGFEKLRPLAAEAARPAKNEVVHQLLKAPQWQCQHLFAMQTHTSDRVISRSGHRQRYPRRPARGMDPCHWRPRHL